MSSEELFNNSKKNRLYPKAKGMSNRAFLLACRNDFGTIDEGIETEKLLRFIQSGEAWKLEQVGQHTIKEWCDWLSYNVEIN